MNRRQLLTSSAAAGLGLGLAPSAVGVSSGGGTARNLITVFVSGGWDQTMAFAPQLDNPLVDGPRVDEDPSNPQDRESIAEYGSIRVAANPFKRPSTTLFFDRWADRCCVVNGIFTGAVGHETATIRMLTGTESNRNADLCAIVGHHGSEALPLGYVALAGPVFVGSYAASSGQVGFNSQLKLLFDRSTTYPPPAGTPYGYPLYAPSVEDELEIDAFLRARADTWVRERGRTRQIADLEESWSRRQRFRESAGDLMQTLVLGKEPTFAIQADLATDLLLRGVCRSVGMDSKSAWDSHSTNAGQHLNFELLYVSLDYLMSNLSDAGLLDSTLVLVVSEMTRTPRLNVNAGKDHWPHATVLMMGAGVKPSGSVGGYDERLESQPVDLQTGDVVGSGASLGYDNLAASILEHLDVDPGPYFGATPFRGWLRG
jgi:hypothetical protein